MPAGAPGPSPFEARGVYHRAGHFGPDPLARTSGRRIEPFSRTPAAAKAVAARSRYAAAELAGLAEAPEIGRHDGADRFRRDAEPFERAAVAPLPPRRRRCRALSISTWSGVIGGFGRNCRHAACSFIAANGTGTSSRRRSMVARTNSISSLNVRTSGPPSS